MTFGLCRGFEGFDLGRIDFGGFGLGRSFGRFGLCMCHSQPITGLHHFLQSEERMRISG